MNAINPLEPGCIDIEFVMERYPDLGLVGGIDVDVLSRGTQQEVRHLVRECFEKIGRGGRYIAASANSIPVYCDPGNLVVMFDEIRIGTTSADVLPAVPVPGAVWLLGSGLLALAGIRRKLK